MRWRDILNPWGALREARAERDSAQFGYDMTLSQLSSVRETASRLRVELERLKRGPKRDAKTGRFVG